MASIAQLPVKPPKILLWGAPGTGKTPFVTSYGKGLQIIDCDDGLGSSRGSLKDAFAADRLLVDAIQILESTPDKAEMWPRIKRQIGDTYNEMVRGTWPFEILAIDSFTAIGGSCLRSIMINSKLPPGKLQMQHWGMAIEEMKELFVIIKAMPVPVITIFHDMESTQGTGDAAVNYKEINIFGKNLPAAITSYHDEIWQQKTKIEAGKMVPYLNTMRDVFTTVRSRQGLPDGTLTSNGLKKILSMVGWTSADAVYKPKVS